MHADLPDYDASAHWEEMEPEDENAPILGSLTVKVIPYSSLQIGPVSKSFCLPLERVPALVDTDRRSVVVPLTLMGLPPWTVHYDFHDDVSGVTTSDKFVVRHEAVSFEGDAASGTTMKSAVSMVYDWKLPRMGRYTITKLEDVKGDGELNAATPEGNTLKVHPCPEVFWQRSTGKKLDTRLEVLESDAVVHLDRLTKYSKRSICHRESHNMTALIYGVPPLSLTFYRRAGRHTKDMKLSAIGAASDHVSEVLDSVSSVGEAKLYSVTLDSGHFEQLGETSLFFTSVQDGRGSQTVYTEGVDADQINIAVMPRPHAQLSCDANTEAVLKRGSSTELETPVELLVNLSGDGPFTLEYVHDARAAQVRDINAKQFTIQAKHIGLYGLASVSDQNCAGAVEKNLCQITPMQPPTIAIQTGVLESPCFGQIGFSFDMQLTGQAPWTVTYELVGASGKSEGESVTVRNPSHKLELQPPEPGKYTLRFVEMKDSKYPHAVPIKNVISTQTFHRPSEVKILEYTKQLCMGDSIQAKLHLSGTGPWTVHYDFVSPNGRREEVIKDIEKSTESFTISKIMDAGTHYLELRKVVDGNLCEVDLRSRTRAAAIEVFGQRPSAAFANTGPVPIIDGQVANLPVHLTGQKGPWKMDLLYQSAAGSKWSSLETQTIKALDFDLPVAKPGRYKIEKISDAICSGVVGEVSEVEVSLLPKPDAEIFEVNGVSLEKYRSSSNAEICEAETGGMLVKMTGRPPFAIEYEVAADSQKPELTRLSLAEAQTSVALKSFPAGLYTYTIKSVSDGNYQKVPLTGRQYSFNQRIHAKPTATFVKSEAPMSVCVGHALNVKQFPRLQLTGQAPWEIEYSVSHQQGGVEKVVTKRTIGDIDDKTYSFRPDTVFQKIGMYHFRILSVKDKHCQSTYVPEDSPVFQVGVAHEPNLSLLSDRMHSCKDDALDLSLYGLPPWTIEYTFSPAGSSSDDNLKTIMISEVSGHKSELLSAHGFSYTIYDGSSHAVSDDGLKHQRLQIKLTQAGQLTLKTICHGGPSSQHWCCRELSIPSHKVHSIPTVRVNAGKHGTDVIREGHHARAHLEFTGVPPFAFTYIRRGDRGRVLDSQSVKDIQGFNHDVVLEEAGTFQVTSIEDQYCSYPRSKRDSK